MYAQKQTQVPTPMTANFQATAPDSKTRPENSPESNRKWECSPSGDQENTQILEVAFTSPATPFRECLSLPPRRVPNAERRSREFLTPAEVESVIKAAEKVGRHGFRDGTLILIAYRHALRVSELVSLRWDQVDFNQAVPH